MAVAKITTNSIADDAVTSAKIASGAVTISDIPDNEITMAKLSQVNLDIAPEILEIQVSAPAAGQATTWLWTWEQSTLPYARRTITNSPEVSVPLYKQGTYTVNNYAAYDLFDQMTQTHSLYLKWIDGAGTDNLVSWATSTGPVSDTHPDINGGAATDVQRINISVPSTINPPTLTAPSVSYTVVNNGSGAYTFSGAAKGDNPNLGPFYRGGTYTFNITASGHPLYLTTDNGTNFSAGTYFGEYTDGVTGSRTDSGTVTITVPNDAPDVLYYQCGNHSSMRGAITIKNLEVETNNNGNYVVYFQHTQEGHKTPVELRPIPSLVNQMCLVYDASSGKFVPQDLATYVENTPSFENKIREVAGTAELVVEDGSAVVAKVNVYDDSTYLPLVGNNAGDQAFATDVNTLFIWDGTNWESTKGGTLTDINATGNITAGGDLTVQGDLTVNGTSTTINSTTLTVDDLNITLASGAADATSANGAGITVDGANASLTYVSAIDGFVLDKRTRIITSSNSTVYGNHENELVIQNEDNTNNNWSSLVFRGANGTASGDISMQHTDHTTGYGKMHLSTRGARGYLPALTVDNGNVAIGTETPESGSYRLTVGDSTAPGIALRKIGSDRANILFDTTNGLQLNNSSYLYPIRIDGSIVTINGNSSGNVGIGTNTPSAKLDVYTGATRYFRVKSVNADLELLSDNNTNPVLRIQGTGNADLVNIYDNASEVIKILSNGHVGIGTNNPRSHKLQVNDNAAEVVTPFSISNVNGDVGNGVGMEFVIDAANDATAAQIYATRAEQPYHASKLHFATRQKNTGQMIEALTIDQSQRVGINTSEPAQKLHVSGGGVSNDNGVTFDLSDGNVNGASEFLVHGNGWIVNRAKPLVHFKATGSGASNGSGAYTSYIQKITSDGTLTTELNNDKMYGLYVDLAMTNMSDPYPAVFNGGKVGIGTTTPSSTLEIVGGSYNSSTTLAEDAGAYALVLPSATGSYTSLNIGHGIGFKSNDNQYNGRGRIVAGINTVDEGTQDASALSFITANTSEVLAEKLRIKASGDVVHMQAAHSWSDNNTTLFANGGIGITSNSDWAIQIAGTYTQRIRFFSSGGGTSQVGDISSDTTSTTYSTTSDYRLKDNIELITDAKDRLMKLRPVKHGWKESDEIVDGFIAHEVQEAGLEYAVTGEKDGDKMQSMDYGRITPVIVAALQDAIKEIAELKQRINDLESK